MLHSFEHRFRRQPPRNVRRDSSKHSGVSSPSSSPEVGFWDPEGLKDSPTSSSLYSFQSDGTPSLSPTSSVSDLGLTDSKNFAADTPAVLSAEVEDLESNVHVRCMVRTRVPTPHGEVFLHLYHNNRDGKEHLAIVVDPAQLNTPADEEPIAKPIRSKSLDEVWDCKSYTSVPIPSVFFFNRNNVIIELCCITPLAFSVIHYG